MKITRLAALDGLELKDATFVRQTFPAHFHDSYSLGLIEQGQERLTFDDRTLVAPAFAVVVINPFDVHANAYVDHDPWRYRTLYVAPELMRFVARRLGWPAGATPWFARELLTDAALYAALLRLHEPPADPTATAAAVLAVLTQLVSYHAARRPVAGSFIPPRTQVQMTEAAHYLRTHATAPLTVEALAARHHLSKFTFIRAFKQVTGLTPISYALLHRINQAKALISTGMPLVEVALETGFYDQAHFTHYFRRYLGVTPVAYRKAVQLGR